MWTAENRPRYNRDKLRYPSDLSDEEWGLVEPLIPPGKPGGGKRSVVMRNVVDGVMYILSTGCQVASDPKRPSAAQHAVRLPRSLSWDGTWSAFTTRST